MRTMPWKLANLERKETPKNKKKEKKGVAKAKRGRAMATSVGRKEKTTKRKTTAPFVGTQATKSKTAGSTRQKGNTVNQVADDNASVLSCGPLRAPSGEHRQRYQARSAAPLARAQNWGREKTAKDTFWWTQGLLFRCAGPEPFLVDDTLLNTKIVTEPVLELGGQSRQTARATYSVVEGVTDDILSVNRAVDAGAKVVFHKPRSYIFRQGNQFLMPYTELAMAKRAK